MPAVTTLIQHHIGGPSQCNKAKEKNYIRIRKRQAFIIIDGMIVYIENLKDSTKTRN